MRSAPASLTGALLSRKGGLSTLGLIADDFSVPEEPIVLPVAAVASREPRLPKGVRKSVMLDRERHFRLNLAAAKLQSSTRQLMVDALDHYLATVVPARVGSACHCLQPRAASCPAPGCTPMPEPAP
jgi:hypothetical protein